MIFVGTDSLRGDGDAARAARRLLFDQNSELRRLLALGLVQVHASAHGHAGSGPTLRSLIQSIRAAFVQHVSVENDLLLPLVTNAPGKNDLHVHDRFAWHDRQRRELEALCAAAQGADDVLADRFDRVARSLLAEIAREESTLARLV
jgi:iron-sulfur cluster repair protein YtfE (RIC family)